MGEMLPKKSVALGVFLTNMIMVVIWRTRLPGLS